MNQNTMLKKNPPAYFRQGCLLRQGLGDRSRPTQGRGSEAKVPAGRPTATPADGLKRRWRTAEASATKPTRITGLHQSTVGCHRSYICGEMRVKPLPAILARIIHGI
jgi:hypothetical protein